jgi:hypothetical protein
MSEQQRQLVELGEAAINPPWQGHLIALSDNGGDLVMVTIHHPRHGKINLIWPRTVAANLHQWLGVALQAPVLSPLPPPDHTPAPAPGHDGLDDGPALPNELKN